MLLTNWKRCCSQKQAHNSSQNFGWHTIGTQNGRLEIWAARKCLILFGWEAGTRTPIARSRVWSPTIGRPPSKRESEFTNQDRGCQLNPKKPHLVQFENKPSAYSFRIFKLNKYPQKLMLELDTFKMHNGLCGKVVSGAHL